MIKRLGVSNSRHLVRLVLNYAGLLGNRVIWYGVAAVIVMQAAFTYWPVSRQIFHVGPLEPRMWVKILAASAVLFGIVELEKAISRKLFEPAPAK